MKNDTRNEQWLKKGNDSGQDNHKKMLRLVCGTFCLLQQISLAYALTLSFCSSVCTVSKDTFDKIKWI